MNPRRCEHVLRPSRCNWINLCFNLAHQFWHMSCHLSVEESGSCDPDQQQPTLYIVSQQRGSEIQAYHLSKWFNKIRATALCSYGYEIQMFPLLISKLSPTTATPSPLEIWHECQIKYAYLIRREHDYIHLLNKSMRNEEIRERESEIFFMACRVWKKKENSSLF